MKEINIVTLLRNFGPKKLASNQMSAEVFWHCPRFGLPHIGSQPISPLVLRLGNCAHETHIETNLMHITYVDSAAQARARQRRAWFLVYFNHNMHF